MTGADVAGGGGADRGVDSASAVPFACPLTFCEAGLGGRVAKLSSGSRRARLAAGGDDGGEADMMGVMGENDRDGVDQAMIGASQYPLLCQSISRRQPTCQVGEG